MTGAGPPTAPGADDRDRTAESRDRTAAARDATAASRDELSQERDDRAAERDARDGRVDLDSAGDRVGAWRDRQAAGADRGSARDDRTAAARDRSLSASEHAELLVDELTGTYRRAAGFMELEREIIKAERTQQAFVLAFVDVDGLKAVNDAGGHAAGDHLLQEVVSCLRGVVREYDVLVRYGGDEFLCGLPDIAVADAAERLTRANTHLQERDHASVSVGLAERAPGEGLAELIARADAAMYLARDAHGIETTDS